VAKFGSIFDMLNTDYTVILFYKFIDIADPESLKIEQKKLGGSLNLKGRMIIAKEGINATLEGKNSDVEQYMETLKQDPRFADILFKESVGTGSAFTKLKIKVRPEIVTLGAGDFDIKNETAIELPAEDLEKMYQNGEDFVVLDLRNDYEIASGYFEKTIDPGLQNFRDLPQKLKELENLKNKKVVTVCTGGIRCEKATCLLKKEGFSNLYQLKDGIHTYMKKYPASNFKGTLFVFDNRMVTPVVPTENRPIVGECLYCQVATEDYANDDSVSPSRKILCCQNCFELHKDRLREAVAIK
jgi:UPF0176 protein